MFGLVSPPPPPPPRLDTQRVTFLRRTFIGDKEEQNEGVVLISKPNGRFDEGLSFPTPPIDH